MDRRNLTALLGILAVAGYQNRDKIAAALRELTQGGAQPQTSGTEPGAVPSQPSGGGLGGLLGGLAGGGLGDLVKGGSAGGVLSGGLGGLLDQFTKNGYGDTADSWVSPGANKPIDDRQLSQALGPDVLEELSAKTGLSEDEILKRLSKDLPKAVDELTPQGQIPNSANFSI
ncbi:YidB family protein [Rhizobium yanglingense]